MRNGILMLLLTFSLISSSTMLGQENVNKLPQEVFKGKKSAMSTTKPKPKNKKKSLGSHFDVANKEADVNAEDMPAVEDLNTTTRSMDENSSAATDESGSPLLKAYDLYVEERGQEALEILEQADENDADVRFLKGLIYSEQGYFEKAEQLFGSLLEQNPNDLDVLDALGWLYYAADYSEEAQLVKSIILELDPNYEMSY